MRICTYCGRKAGWFSDAHNACIQKAQCGMEALKSIAAKAVENGNRYDEISDSIEKVVAEHAIPQPQVAPAILEGWGTAASAVAIQEPISDHKEAIIFDIYKGLGYKSEQMVKTTGFQNVVMSNVVWRVLNGTMEPYEGPIRFNLHAGEVPIFGIANVLLKQERTATSYQGGYGGANIRVASGLYYHLGGVRGHRVQSTSLQEVDYGDLLITTQAIYFGGGEHGINFRLPYRVILRFQPYSDAIGICKDGGKEQIFAPKTVAECGWFLFNLLQTLAAQDAKAKAHTDG